MRRFLRRIILALTICVLALTPVFGFWPPSPNYWTYDPSTGLLTPQQGSMQGAVGYGVRWDSSTDAYVKGVLVNGYFVPCTPVSFPVQSRMRRCILSDAGVVQYYLCATDSTKKADCVTASNLDGTDGQVMLEIPQFHYIRYHYGNFRYWFVGERQFSFVDPAGTTVHSAIHPVFYKGGSSTPSAYRYVGAYQANLWDASATSYVGGVSITEDCVNDKLASVSGVLPIVNFTRACGRTMAAARGAGWHQYDNAMNSALWTLFVTEYGSLKSQQSIGDGITGYGAWPNNTQALAGNSNAIGNATGNSSGTVAKWAASTVYAAGVEIIPNAVQNGYTYRTTAGGTSAGPGSEPTWPTTLGNTVVDNTVTWTCVRTNKYMSYRGVENWYGHIWQFVDGSNVNNDGSSSKLYLSTNYNNYADDTATNYTYVGNLAAADGYITNVLNTLGPWPSAVGGGSATYLADLYYTSFDTAPSDGWHVALVGGDAVDGAYAGASCWDLNYSSSSALSRVGGRICF